MTKQMDELLNAIEESEVTRDNIFQLQGKIKQVIGIYILAFILVALRYLLLPIITGEIIQLEIYAIGSGLMLLAGIIVRRYVKKVKNFSNVLVDKHISQLKFIIDNSNLLTNPDPTLMNANNLDRLAKVNIPDYLKEIKLRATNLEQIKRER